MPYNPISFAVVRDALKWMHIPQPVSIRRLSFYEWPSGNVTAEYRAVWELEKLYKQFGDTWEDGEPAFTRFMYKLRDCFTEDIHPTQLHTTLDTGQITAVLYVTVTPQSEQLPLFA